jgi:lipid-A-disaccharide synthase-like uncharacterized protein
MIVVNMVLSLVGAAAFVWLVLGGLAAPIWVIVYLSGDHKLKKFPLKKWLMVCFGGVGVLVVVFVLTALVYVVKAVVGG